MSRYQIMTSTETEPGDVQRLRRAFDRMAVNWSDMVEGVEICGTGGGAGRGFVITIDVEGPPRGAALECERLFAAAWYDAFGPRGSTHIGAFTDGSGEYRRLSAA